MSKNWSYIRDEWLKRTYLTEDDAKWAFEALINTEEDLFEIERKFKNNQDALGQVRNCLLYTSPSPRDATLSRMPSSA